MIDALIDALENATSDREALVAALDAWRDTRDPLLAAIVEHLGARVRAAPIAKANLHEAWLARAAAARPEDVDRLLDAIGRQVDSKDLGHMAWDTPMDLRFPRLIDRIRALALLPDDPRIARALTELVRRGPWTGGFLGDLSVVYGPMLALIARIGDPRSADVLSALHERPVHRVGMMRDYLHEALPETLAAIPPAPSLDDAVRTRIAAIAARHGLAKEQRTEARGTSADELLAAIYADPDDDGAREVYADWLLERKDPRGEFIALQFAAHRGTASPKDEKRMAALLRAHQNEWLGDLAIVTSGRSFSRGMLEEAQLLGGAVASSDLWERVLGDERLSTLRALAKGKANEPLYIRFLASPARRSLRRIEAMTSSTIEALVGAHEPLRIEHVQLDRHSLELLQLLAGAKTLPALRTLEIPARGRLDAVCKRLSKSGLASRLTRLLVNYGWGERPSTDDFVVAHESLDIEEVGLVSYKLELWTRGRGAERTLHLVWGSAAEGLSELLRTLPRAARLTVSSRGIGKDRADQLKADAAEVLRAASACAPEVEFDDKLSAILGLAGRNA